MMKGKVAIIGAGVSGIMAAKALLDKNIAFTIFESEPYFGGQWQYTGVNEIIDIRENDSVIPSAMYDCMRTNFPISMMEMPGMQHEHSTKVFPSRNEFYSYIKSYVEKFSLKRFMKFNQKITSIIKNNSAWKITTSQNNTFHFDSIILATGREHKPYIPTIEGLSSFVGSIIHSNSYRNPNLFKNKNVVVLGTSYSGQEISMDLANTANHVFFCGRFTNKKHAHNKMSQAYGKNNAITQHPCIESLGFTEVRLIDGTILTNIHSIIFCTGYSYHYPYLMTLQDSIKISDEYVGPLYFDIFYPQDPTLMFLGLPVGSSHFYAVSLQAEYCAQFIQGSTSLPHYEQMMVDIKSHLNNLRKQGLEESDFLKYGDRQQEYHMLLCNKANIPYNPAIEKTRQALSKHRKRYPFQYRDKPFHYSFYS